MRWEGFCCSRSHLITGSRRVFTSSRRNTSSLLRCKFSHPTLRSTWLLKARDTWQPLACSIGAGSNARGPSWHTNMHHGASFAGLFLPYSFGDKRSVTFLITYRKNPHFNTAVPGISTELADSPCLICSYLWGDLQLWPRCWSFRAQGPPLNQSRWPPGSFPAASRTLIYRGLMSEAVTCSSAAGTAVSASSRQAKHSRLEGSYDSTFGCCPASRRRLYTSRRHVWSTEGSLKDKLKWQWALKKTNRHRCWSICSSF